MQLLQKARAVFLGPGKVAYRRAWYTVDRAVAIAISRAGLRRGT